MLDCNLDEKVYFAADRFLQKLHFEKPSQGVGFSLKPKRKGLG